MPSSSPARTRKRAVVLGLVADGLDLAAGALDRADAGLGQRGLVLAARAGIAFARLRLDTARPAPAPSRSHRR